MALYALSENLRSVLVDDAWTMFQSPPIIQITIYGVAIVCAVSIVQVVYRLWLSPLAQFPGSKLAAATGWVETYHDVFRGGQFIFKLDEWHAKYGPVVRINPWEIHVADPDFADVIFAGTSRFDKKLEWKYRFGIPHSTFDTIEHHHHRMRRAAIAPFFSKQRVGAILDFITTKMQRLADRLEEEYKGMGRPIVLNKCFTTVTFDIITYYAFARSFEYLETPNFEAPLTSAIKELATTLHVMGHFPWLLTLLQSIPQFIAAAMNPAMGHVFAFHAEIESQIRDIKSGKNAEYKSLSHKTVFHELVNSDLPEAEKSLERLKHEGASIVGAGVETTTTSLSKACFYILDRMDVRAKLVDELTPVFPNPRETPPLATLESLPYLSAVVEETLRMTIGVSSRTVRKSPTSPVMYQDWVIPAGAYFSTTTYFVHKNPAVFTDPLEFRPERWLRTGDVNAGRGESLSKYLMPFGKGPRMCLGMNLARAELFIGLAVLFRRCRLELFETTKEAVEMRSDYFIPFPKPGIEGVKVLVE